VQGDAEDVLGPQEEGETARMLRQALTSRKPAAALHEAITLDLPANLQVYHARSVSCFLFLLFNVTWGSGLHP
jgi:hypothetical protein